MAFPSPFSLNQLGADATAARTARPAVCVCMIKRMALLAMRASQERLCAWTPVAPAINAALNVVQSRHRFKVLGIYASAIAAQVVKFKADWNSAFPVNVTDAMSAAIYSISIAKKAISRLACGRDPVPALGRFVNYELRKEPSQFPVCHGLRFYPMSAFIGASA